MIIFEKKTLRISLITPRLLRTERGSFTDLPTQTVIDRNFCEPKYTLEERGKTICVATDLAVFEINGNNGDLLSVKLNDGRLVKDFKKGRLPGTARTLDAVNGKVKLSPGITSRSGAALLDDSKSLIVNPDGNISPRGKCSDRYWFAYGSDYQGQLRDFFKLTGNVPLTVATIDMDWHWTDVVSRFGKEAKAEPPKSIEQLVYNLFLHGWTGYSWNTELFPDYKELLSWLHGKGLRVTLNTHPSQGVRFFEDQYAEICERLGRDPSTKEPIAFDVTDENFRSAYFELLHHGYEEDGVDFWWIDWQQGKKTKIRGLDPLWALNHYHTADSGRGDKRPLILSRFAGLGSHRYPLGFSGDTIVTWKSLDFQPYFTNSAANAGYTWWSHDIGGHMRGIQSEELYLRWLQYGVFSPINRLHSSNMDALGKEPWKRSERVKNIAEDFLRLRHRLIPYLYSANYRTYADGEPICMPLYYRYDKEEAYNAKNEYVFGGQLLVCPITRPTDEKGKPSYVDAWLPEGRWTDVFTGEVYEGERTIRMYRDLESIPVLAKEGAIVPTYRENVGNDISLERPLEVHIWRGNGSFELYEDDGETNTYKDGKYAITRFELKEEGDALCLTITPSDNSGEILPKERTLYLKFRDLSADEMPITISDKPVTINLKIPR